MTPKQFVEMVARLEVKPAGELDIDDCLLTINELIEHAKHINQDRTVDNMTLIPAVIANAIESARARYAAPSDNDIEVDDFPALSIGEDGVWVGMWGWVPNEETEDTEDPPLCPEPDCLLNAGHDGPHDFDADDLPF